MVTWIGAVAAGALIWAAPAAAGYCGDGSTTDQCATAESGTGSEVAPATPPDGTAEEPAPPVAEPVPPPADPAQGEDPASFYPSYEATGDSAGGEPTDEGGSPLGASPGFETAQDDSQYCEVGVDCPDPGRGVLDPGGGTDPDPTDTGGEPSVAAASGSGGSEESASEGSALGGTTSQGSSATEPVDAGSASAAATGGALPSTGLGLGGPALAGIALLGAGHALRRRLG